MNKTYVIHIETNLCINNIKKKGIQLMVITHYSDNFSDISLKLIICTFRYMIHSHISRMDSK